MKRALVSSSPYRRLRDALIGAHGANMQMAREDLARRWVRGDGIEIGPLTRPLALPRRARVRYVDRADRATLLREEVVPDPSAMPAIDVISDAQHLAEFADASLDFVIAAHVLEHLQDPVGALERLVAVLRPGGIALITLPDARHSFDAPRERTTVEHLLRDHEEGPHVSRERHYEEWATLIEGRTGADVAARVAEYASTDAHHHFHVWELTDFLALMRALNLPFELVEARACGEEFSVVLRRTS